MARECIYCGSGDIFREDVVPCWLAEFFVADGTVEIEKGHDHCKIEYPTDRPKLVIKCVCKKCNNGWMSQVQKDAKPIFERLWNGKDYTLDFMDCRALALWAVMTCMSAQTQGEQDTRRFTPLDQTLMWKHQRIPDLVTIWIAQAIGHMSVQMESHSHGTNPFMEKLQARSSVITMAFGTLAFQVLKLVPEKQIPPDTEVRVGQAPGNWDEIAVQVWPTKPAPARWPPTLGIMHLDELDRFARRFHTGG